PDTPVCSPQNVKFENTSEGAISYAWSFGDGKQSVADSAEHRYVNDGGLPRVFLASLVAINTEQCRDSTSVPITVYPKPEFLVSASPLSGCSPLTVFFPSIVGVSKYEWKYGNNIIFGSTGNVSSTFGNNESSTHIYTVQLIAGDKQGCSDTSTTMITVFPEPVARFTARPLNVFVPDQAVSFTNES